METAPADALRRLASARGVAVEYTDQVRGRVAVDDATLRAVLHALGTPAHDDDAVDAALRDVDLAPWRSRVPACVVARDGDPAHVRLVLDQGATAGLRVELAGGSTRRLGAHRADADGEDEVREVDGRVVVRRTVALPPDLPPGEHRLVLDAGDAAQSVPLLAAPRMAPQPPGRRWGWTAQLYGLRSGGSWGMGDLEDLRTLVAATGQQGAAFVMVNPLHADVPVPPQEPSPYFPASRRRTSPLVLRPERLSGYDRLDDRARAEVDRLAAAGRAAGGADRIDRDAVLAAKLPAFEAVFAVGRTGAEEDAFRAFLEREGEALRHWAVYCALAEEHGRSWREWPEDLRAPAAPGVAEAADRLARRVALHAWLQWQAELQLDAAQDAARAAGMPIGVVHDVAVGVSGDGPDAWALQEDLALGVSIGAPPDLFNPLGQDWQLPPLRPDRLTATAYEPFRQIVRAALRHGGGLRIDHVAGLFRQWWVPSGSSPDAGTYVAFPSDDLLDVLVLEAHLAGAVVVGEDLGNVEPRVRRDMDDRGILGNRVVWFERTDADAPLPASDYPHRSLVLVTTHDLPTAAGWWIGEGERLKQELDLLPEDADPAQERARAEESRRGLHGLLVEEGLIEEDEDGVEALVAATHRFAARTPAVLVAAAVRDAVGDRRQPNLPGTVDEYPNWRLPVAGPDGTPRTLEQVLEDAGVAAMARVLGDGRRDGVAH